MPHFPAKNDLYKIKEFYAENEKRKNNNPEDYYNQINVKDIEWKNVNNEI